jgi:AcrR family transcriptional regulator
MARMTREQKRQVTLQKLRAAALKEFAQSGFGGASIDRITESAGFSRGAFYANYGSKEELLLDLMSEHNVREIDEWSNMLQEGQELEEIFQGLEQRFIRYLKQADWGMFAAEAQLQAKRDKAFAAEYRNYLAQVNTHSEQAIGLLFAKAGRQPPVDPLNISVLIRNMVTGLSLEIGADGLPKTVEEAAAMLMFMLRSVLAQGKPSAATGIDSTT